MRMSARSFSLKSSLSRSFIRLAIVLVIGVKGLPVLYGLLGMIHCIVVFNVFLELLTTVFALGCLRLVRIKIRITDHSICIGVIFIHPIGEDRNHSEVVLPLLLLFTEAFIVGHQGFFAAHTENRGELPLMSFAVMVFNDPIHNSINTILVLEELLFIDCLYLLINQASILPPQFAPILH